MKNLIFADYSKNTIHEVAFYMSQQNVYGLKASLKSEISVVT